MNKRQINKALRDCSFNPNERGPMRVVIDVNDPHYFLNRAIEAIKSSDLRYSPVRGLRLFDTNQLTFAIKLLILAKLKIDEENQKSV